METNAISKPKKLPSVKELIQGFSADSRIQHEAPRQVATQCSLSNIPLYTFQNQNEAKVANGYKMPPSQMQNSGISNTYSKRSRSLTGVGAMKAQFTSPTTSMDGQNSPSIVSPGSIYTPMTDQSNLETIKSTMYAFKAIEQFHRKFRSSFAKEALNPDRPVCDEIGENELQEFLRSFSEVQFESALSTIQDLQKLMQHLYHLRRSYQKEESSPSMEEPMRKKRSLAHRDSLEMVALQVNAQRLDRHPSNSSVHGGLNVELSIRAPIFCQHCGSDETPEWRKGPGGSRTLCNACGLFYSKLIRKFGVSKADETMKSRKNLGSHNNRRIAN